MMWGKEICGLRNLVTFAQLFSSQQLVALSLPEGFLFDHPFPVFQRRVY